MRAALLALLAAEAYAVIVAGVLVLRRTSADAAAIAQAHGMITSMQVNRAAKADRMH